MSMSDVFADMYVSLDRVKDTYFRNEKELRHLRTLYNDVYNIVNSNMDDEDRGLDYNSAIKDMQGVLRLVLQKCKP